MEPTYVEPSQRSDGSWRKEIRIKPGYVPKEERPIYISKGKQVFGTKTIGGELEDTTTGA